MAGGDRDRVWFVDGAGARGFATTTAAAGGRGAGVRSTATDVAAAATLRADALHRATRDRSGEADDTDPNEPEYDDEE